MLVLTIRPAGHVLNEFVQSAALPYLESDDVGIRRQAASTCSRLFVRDPICHRTSPHAIEIVGDVLDKLLTVGVADPGKSGQVVWTNTVLNSLSGRRSNPSDRARIARFYL